MEKKHIITIKLTTIFLIILLIILITGFFIYKSNKDKQLPSEVLTTSENDLIDINNYAFELDSQNKYTIITDFRWMTMQNDGGSNTNIYYQIDLDNNIISKVLEDYKANLGGSPKEEKNVIYIKKIDTNIQEEAKSLLNEIITKEDINETNNYEFFTISSLNTKKDIYNVNTIKNINQFLSKIDELKD